MNPNNPNEFSFRRYNRSTGVPPELWRYNISTGQAELLSNAFPVQCDWNKDNHLYWTGQNSIWRMDLSTKVIEPTGLEGDILFITNAYKRVSLFMLIVISRNTIYMI